MMEMRLGEVCGLGYVLGSFPFGYWVGCLQGIDIRQHGSGNIGATNVWRTLGRKWGLLVFALDALKGAGAVWVAAWWLQRAGVSQDVVSLGGVLGGLAGILGHTFPFWLKFRGGKGVATSAGVLAGLTPIGLAVAGLVWGGFFARTRYVAVASIAAAVALPLTLVVVMLWRGVWDWPLIGFGVMVSAMVIIRHKSNIKRLLSGTELRATSRKGVASK